MLLAASDKAELKGFGDGYIKLVTGVGPVLAAAQVSKAISEHRPDVVVSVGSAGSLGKLGLGEIVSFGSVVSSDQDLTFYHLPLGATLGPGRETIASLALDRSSRYVLVTSARFADKRPDIPGDASDMEAYGVAMAARIHNVPCYAVKVITDIVGERVSLSDYSRRLREWRSGLSLKVDELIGSL